MRKIALSMLAAAAALAISGTANAAITLTSVPGTDPYTGPTPTYDFEGGGPTGGAPVTGGLVTNTSVPGVSAAPFGSDGFFWTVGPTDGTPGIMDLSSFTDLLTVSFIWGSVDSYNTLEILAADGVTVLESFVGNDVFNPANGNQTDPNTNPVVTLHFSGADMSAATFLRLSSSQNAFETDNFAIQAVPEPGTWAMMLLGFGAVGFAMRRRRKPSFARLAAIA